MAQRSRTCARLGVKIAIDDFGTGYSSLKYLTRYPVNRLKLAQEFVFRVAVDYRNAAEVRAAIRLAHELGLDVIAEGVETEAQMHFLIGAGCEQGGRLLFQSAGQSGAGHCDASRRPDRARFGAVAAIHIRGVTGSNSASARSQALPLRKASTRRRSRLVGRLPVRACRAPGLSGASAT
jgi:EAL domain-containing protein (putative c-di-GMP-specific phosphodiesterase class I)